MTKKLEELLNLPDNKELVKETEQEIKNKEKAEQARQRALELSKKMHDTNARNSKLDSIKP